MRGTPADLAKPRVPRVLALSLIPAPAELHVFYTIVAICLQKKTLVHTARGPFRVRAIYSAMSNPICLEIGAICAPATNVTGALRATTS
jgi:hypothetical protein